MCFDLLRGGEGVPDVRVLLLQVPEWLHARLRDAARTTHAVYGERFCPVGVDSADRWTPRYEPVQYTEYGVGAHYAGWHTDAELDSTDTEDARAVTVVVLLSDTDAFDGGQFQVFFYLFSSRCADQRL